MKKVLAIIVMMTMLISLAACSSPGNNGSGSANQNTPVPTESSGSSEPVKGGIIKVMGMPTLPSTLLWHQVRAVHEIAFSSYTQETLMKYDGNGNPQPFLLESMEGDNEKKVWTLKVKKGIKFSDGSDLNAEVVAWNLNIYKEKGILSGSFYSAMDKAEVVDDYTVAVHMKEWDSLFPYTLARSCLIASKVAYDTYGEDYLAEHPIGTGPFILDKWERDVSLKYVKNPNYWQGEPNVDGVEVVIYANELVAQAAMEAGELDAMATTNYNLVSQMANSSTKYEINAASLATSAYTLCFNSSDPEDPFYDPKVRQAVSYAIDSKAIVDTLMNGYGAVSNQWCLPGSEFYNDEIEGQPYDPEKAKAMLAEAGYPNGFETMLTVSNVTAYTDVCQIIVEQLSKVGVKVELRPIEGAAYANYIGGWEKGMLLHPMGMENGAASQMATTFVQGLGFALGVKSFDHPDDLDALVKDANYSKPEEVATKFQHIQKVVFDDYTFMKTIAIVPTIGITRPEVHDGNFCKDQNLMNTFYKAWISKK